MALLSKSIFICPSQQGLASSQLGQVPLQSGEGYIIFLSLSASRLLNHTQHSIITAMWKLVYKHMWEMSAQCLARDIKER